MRLNIFKYCLVRTVRLPSIKKFAQLVLGLLVFLLSSCAEKPVIRREVYYPKIKQPAVVVRLLETKDSLIVSSDAPFSVKYTPPEGEEMVFSFSVPLEARLAVDGLSVGPVTLEALETDLCQATFLPKDERSFLFLNGKPYRGILKIIYHQENGTLLVLNIVNLEDYLKGVVPVEMGRLGKSEMEALEAQAIAARTYALYQADRNQMRGYDLEATRLDQIYLGVTVEDPLVSRAIGNTRGKVLTCQGRLICAYYSSNCGGSTEYVHKVWDTPEEPYLIPREDSIFCSWSKSSSWEERWDKDALEKEIKAFLDSTIGPPRNQWGDLLDLRIIERTPSGRVEQLDVVTDEGVYPLRADKIRWALKRNNGANSILPSTRFDLEIERGEGGTIRQVIARGRGNGHGVGMCQTGVIGMARAGYSFKDILTHYYAGVKIIKGY